MYLVVHPLPINDTDGTLTYIHTCRAIFGGAFFPSNRVHSTGSFNLIVICYQFVEPMEHMRNSVVCLLSF